MSVETRGYTAIEKRSQQETYGSFDFVLNSISKIFGNGKASAIISKHVAYGAHPSLWCLI